MYQCFLSYSGPCSSVQYPRMWDVPIFDAALIQYTAVAQNILSNTFCPILSGFRSYLRNFFQRLSDPRKSFFIKAGFQVEHEELKVEVDSV